MRIKDYNKFRDLVGAIDNETLGWSSPTEANWLMIEGWLEDALEIVKKETGSD